MQDIQEKSDDELRLIFDAVTTSGETLRATFILDELRARRADRQTRGYAAPNAIHACGDAHHGPPHLDDRGVHARDAAAHGRSRHACLNTGLREAAEK